MSEEVRNCLDCGHPLGPNHMCLRPGRLVPRLVDYQPGMKYRPTIPIPDPAPEPAPPPVPADLSRAELDLVLLTYLKDPVFAKRFGDCMELIRAKNADYTQGTAQRDRIAAFRRVANDIDTPMRKVWATFAQKHWGAVMKYVKDGQVESEPIETRINDLINYFVLLGAIVSDEGSK